MIGVLDVEDDRQFERPPLGLSEGSYGGDYRRGYRQCVYHGCVQLGKRGRRFERKKLFKSLGHFDDVLFGTYFGRGCFAAWSSLIGLGTWSAMRLPLSSRVGSRSDSKEVLYLDTPETSSS
jgi:hypothetical protein